MSWTIYCHIHTETGRRYIGLTKRTMERRWSQHVCQSRHTKNGRWHFPNAIRKYGAAAFSHEVLEVCETLEEANTAEEIWVTHFDTMNPKKGFNLTKGGKHIPHTKKNPWDRPEFRAKMLSVAKSKWTPALRARISAAQTGVKLSPKHCEAIAKARLGKPPSPEAIAKGKKTQEKNWDVETRKRVSEESLKNWQDPEYQEKVRVTCSAAVLQAWKEKRQNWLKHDETHKICKVHGRVLLSDCYRKVHKNKWQTTSYECKLCVDARNKRIRKRRLGRK